MFPSSISIEQQKDNHFQESAVLFHSDQQITLPDNGDQLFECDLQETLSVWLLLNFLEGFDLNLNWNDWILLNIWKIMDETKGSRNPAKLAKIVYWYSSEHLNVLPFFTNA